MSDGPVQYDTQKIAGSTDSTLRLGCLEAKCVKCLQRGKVVTFCGRGESGMVMIGDSNGSLNSLMVRQLNPSCI